MFTNQRTSVLPAVPIVSEGARSMASQWLTFCVLCALLSFVAAGSACAEDSAPALEQDVPQLRREFRAAWVATVANIDWPSRPGLSTSAQQAEMVELLDCAARLHLNAIILQVRPSCDAFYASSLEPWSEYLTGTMGQAPQPSYDPLAFAVAEAHRRGIELHAWFNPYRVRHADAKTPASPDHISQAHPELVKKYGDYLWLDPGEPAATKHTLAVVRDVVERYDVDGVHLDDYFYPYPVENSEGERVPFPDDESWHKAVAAGYTLERADWRRRNVNRLVRSIFDEIKRLKPWVKFGISPFGIGRPGMPPQITGFDQYESLYADAERWFDSGWVDYFTPQLYWKIGPPEHSYAALLDWWHKQNEMQRHLWPGNYTSRLLTRGRQHWRPEEIIAQIWVTRAQKGATGNVHFSMKALQRNSQGIADMLLAGPYQEPALVPASPWLSNSSDEEQLAPEFSVQQDASGSVVQFASESPWLWIVRAKYGDTWDVAVVAGSEREHRLNGSLANQGRPDALEAVVVSTVNRLGKESPRAWHRTLSQ